MPSSARRRRRHHPKERDRAVTISVSNGPPRASRTQRSPGSAFAPGCSQVGLHQPTDTQKTNPLRHLERRLERSRSCPGGGSVSGQIIGSMTTAQVSSAESRCRLTSGGEPARPSPMGCTPRRSPTTTGRRCARSRPSSTARRSCSTGTGRTSCARSWTRSAPLGLPGRTYHVDGKDNGGNGRSGRTWPGRTLAGAGTSCPRGMGTFPGTAASGCSTRSATRVPS